MNISIRKISVGIGAAAILFLLAGLVFTAAPAQAQETQPDLPARTVTVTGTGSVSARPDEAVVRLGVEVQADTAQSALSQANQQIQSVTGALQDAGVPEANIQTQAVQLFPNFRQPGPELQQEPEQVGFTARNILQVEVDNLDSLGELIDAAVQAGANVVESIQLAVGNPTALMGQARQAAFQNAQATAEDLAQLAGAQLGDVVTIQETSAVPFGPVGFGGVAAEEAAAVPISPGTEQVQVNIQVTWELVGQ